MAMDWKPARRSTCETLISKHEMIQPQRLFVLLVNVVQFCLRGVVVGNMPAIFFRKPTNMTFGLIAGIPPEVTVNSSRASKNNRPAIICRWHMLFTTNCVPCPPAPLAMNEFGYWMAFRSSSKA